MSMQCKISVAFYPNFGSVLKEKSLDLFFIFVNIYRFNPEIFMNIEYSKKMCCINIL